MQIQTPEGQALRKELLPGLWTHAEIMEAMRWKDRTLRLYTQRGLPFIKVGFQRFYEPDKVREWILTHKRNGPPRGPGRPRKY